MVTREGDVPHRTVWVGAWPHLGSPWVSLCWMSRGQWPGNRQYRALPLSVVAAIIHGSHHLSQLTFYTASGCLHSCVQDHLLLPAPTHPRLPSHCLLGRREAASHSVHLLLIFLMAHTMFSSPQGLPFLFLKNLLEKSNKRKQNLMLTISFFPLECSDQLGEASRLIGKYEEQIYGF